MSPPAEPHVETSPVVADEVRTTTCYMCACRCGIRVHLRNGEIRYIDGNPKHPVNRGVLCAKGSAGIMQQMSPAKLISPLKRVGPRGSGEFEEITWDEALATATEWLGRIRKSDPRKLGFFTGRDQSQALTGFWASQFGTPNYAAHGGFCSVNMAAAGLYTIGGSFWEFGEPDWDRTKYLLMFGVAEDHASNPIKSALGRLKTRGEAKFVSINPIRTGYSAIADEWLPIRPGTDGLLVLALVHELLRTRQIDLEYLVRYTNAAWLVHEAPGEAHDGLFVRDSEGCPQGWDTRSDTLADARSTESLAATGTYTLPDGGRARPVLDLVAHRYLDPAFAPEAVADRTGIAAATIRRIAGEIAAVAFEQQITLDIPWTDWKGERHAQMTGRPVSVHAMRGISAHSNGFQTCRAIHLLQILLGSIDCPGGFRYKPPYPRPAPPPLKPSGRDEEVGPGQVLPGPPLGFPSGPEDLLVDGVGNACRIDKAFSWEHPLAAHGMLHTVITNAWRGEPYPLDTLFLFMANMSWNSAMNTAETMRMLTDRDEASGEYRIPRIIYSDAYASEMVAYADLVLPDTTYLERWDCVSLTDRPISEADGPADAIRQPVLQPDRDVRPFQDVLIELGHRLGLPAFCQGDGAPAYPEGYKDYIVKREYAPGVGPLAGWRGTDGQSHGRGAPNENQLARYIENDCHWFAPLPDEMRFYKHANAAYLAHAHDMGWIGNAAPVVLQIYCEPLQRFRLAAQGHGAKQPPAQHRDRVNTYFDPLPYWYPPFEETHVDETAFPLHAVTQRPMAMYHSWGSQNAWLRQIHGWNPLFVPVRVAEELDLEDGDWVWVESHNGRIKSKIKITDGCNADTVWTWNAIGKRRGAWGLSDDAPEGARGFLLNHLIGDRLPSKAGDVPYANADPITGQAAWFDLRVRLTKADAPEASEPQFPPLQRPPRVNKDAGPLRYGAQFKQDLNHR